MRQQLVYPRGRVRLDAKKDVREVLSSRAMKLQSQAVRVFPFACPCCVVSLARTARRFGAGVHAIDLWALGGLCWTDDVLSPVDRSLMALAGPGINLGLAAIGIAVLQVAGPTLGPLHGPVSGLAGANLGVGLLNLLPFRPMDWREGLALPARWLRARAATRSVKSAMLGRRPFDVIIDGRGGGRDRNSLN